MCGKKSMVFYEIRGEAHLLNRELVRLLDVLQFVFEADRNVAWQPTLMGKGLVYDPSRP